MSTEPRGYTAPIEPAGGVNREEIRACLRCGAVVADVRVHDLWHGGIDR